MTIFKIKYLELDNVKQLGGAVAPPMALTPVDFSSLNAQIISDIPANVIKNIIDYQGGNDDTYIHFEGEEVNPINLDFVWRNLNLRPLYGPESVALNGRPAPTAEQSGNEIDISAVNFRPIFDIRIEKLKELYDNRNSEWIHLEGDYMPPMNMDTIWNQTELPHPHIKINYK